MRKKIVQSRIGNPCQLLKPVQVRPGALRKRRARLHAVQRGKGTAFAHNKQKVPPMEHHKRRRRGQTKTRHKNGIAARGSEGWAGGPFQFLPRGTIAAPLCLTPIRRPWFHALLCIAGTLRSLRPSWPMAICTWPWSTPSAALWFP